MSLAGKTISNYHIHSKLGGGGLGVVYKARDSKLTRLVALKFLSPALDRADPAMKRFSEEVGTTSALNHPNICSIHDILETDNGQLFIVMAYYEGKTLKQMLDAGPGAMDPTSEAWGLRGVPTVQVAVARPSAESGEADKLIGEPPVPPPPVRAAFSISEAISIAGQIADGLAATHEQGIVHSNIKPANVAVTKTGRPIILDFGLTRLEAEIDLARTSRKGQTPDYLSPEQVRGGRVDHQTDIWAVGAMLYEMVTGKKPFPGEHYEDVIECILDKEPEVVEDADLQAVFESALSKDKLTRYGAARELMADLAAIERRIAIELMPPEPQPIRLRDLLRKVKLR